MDPQAAQQRRRSVQQPATLTHDRVKSYDDDPRKTVTIPAVHPRTMRTKPKLPNRTTKTSQKLTLFPDDEELRPEDVTDDEVYNQITQLPLGTIRRDAERVRKDRGRLPRVKAYCTASFFRMDELMRWLQERRSINGTNPKRFDECIYTPFALNGGAVRVPTSPHVFLDVGYASAPERATRFANADAEDEEQPLLSPGPPPAADDTAATLADGAAGATLDIPPVSGELFFFDYGVFVCWGLTPDEELAVFKLLVPFEDEKLVESDVENEEFSFHYDPQQQPRIYNDIITLRHPHNYMVKLTISHAIAQSTKMALFENLVDDTIDATKHIPQEMARSGKVNMTRTAITKKIGQLFIMRINVNLVSNVLDTPEIFWSEPSLQPLYNAMRGYLEISQRAELLNQRVEVISDLLDMMKEHLNYSHSEQLEWVIIYLITFEAIIGIITVLFDVINYQDKLGNSSGKT